MNFLIQVGKWILGGIIMGLAGRMIINVIDGKPLFQEPSKEVVLRLTDGGEIQKEIVE